MSDGTLTPDDIAVLRARRAPSGDIVDLTIVQATHALAQMFGTTLEEARGRGLLELLPWHDRGRFDAFVRVVETGTPFTVEFDAQYGGVDRLMKISASPFEDGLLLVVRDVTAEHDVVDSLRQGSELFAAITQALNDAVAVWSAVRDEDGTIVDLRYDFVNASAERLVGMDREQLIGKGLLELFPERGQQGVFAQYLEVIETGVPTTIEVPWGRDGDVERVVEVSAVRFGDDRVVVAGREITKHKQTEERLRASEGRYRLLTDFASDGAVQTRRGIIEWISPS